jgi:hypothetical protein
MPRRSNPLLPGLQHTNAQSQSVINPKPLFCLPQGSQPETKRGKKRKRKKKKKRKENR